jgi:hypothetical protein
MITAKPLKRKGLQTQSTPENDTEVCPPSALNLNSSCPPSERIENEENSIPFDFFKNKVQPVIRGELFNKLILAMIKNVPGVSATQIHYLIQDYAKRKNYIYKFSSSNVSGILLHLFKTRQVDRVELNKAYRYFATKQETNYFESDSPITSGDTEQ